MVGRRGSPSAPAEVTGSGELLLLANDCSFCNGAEVGCYADNEGSITVTVGPA